MANLNPSAISSQQYRRWNFSNPSNPEYRDTITGTVQAIHFVQHYDAFKKQYERWSDGRIKWDIEMAIAEPDGQLINFSFQPASKAAREGKKPSIHVELFKLTGNTDMMNLIGKTISITSPAGTYGVGNPRPFIPQIVEAGPYQLSEPLPERYKNAKMIYDGGTEDQPPMPTYPTPPVSMQPVAPQVTPQGYYAPPVAQPMPQYQQPVQQMPQQFQQQVPVAPVAPVNAAPVGMDPALAAAMQAMGAQNVTPYDGEIPF